MLVISVDAICSGLGHWQVTVTDGTETVQFPCDWADLQTSLSKDELGHTALAVLRAKYAGVPLEGLSDLLLDGVVL